MRKFFYGLLVMVVCDEDGVVYDLWHHPANYHKVKSFRIRQSKDVCLRCLLEHFELVEGRGYRRCKGTRVCESKEDRPSRRAVESVNARIKLFSSISKAEEMNNSKA